MSNKKAPSESLGRRFFCYSGGVGSRRCRSARRCFLWLSSSASPTRGPPSVATRHLPPRGTNYGCSLGAFGVCGESEAWVFGASRISEALLFVAPSQHLTARPHRSPLRPPHRPHPHHLRWVQARAAKAAAEAG